METNPNIKYVWRSVAIVVVPIVIISLAFLGDLLDSPVLALSALGIITPVLAVLLANSRVPSKNSFGYGLPVALLFLAGFFFWKAATCTGKFCGLGYLSYMLIAAFCAVLFAAFYWFGSTSRRRSPKFMKYALVVEVLLLSALFLWITYL